MENTMAANEFTLKFQKLNEQNQKYILAIEQAMLYAQDSEKSGRKEQIEKRGNTKKKKEL